MESAEIARRFLAYFEQRGHTVVPSASLIAEDPTLLLVNAGMQPFKPYFLGQQAPPFTRATSAQKCVRTPDIEEVGKTTRHAHVLPDAGQLLVRRLLQGAGAIPLRLGAADQARGRRRVRVPRGPAVGHRLHRRRRGVPASGGTRSACRRAASSAAAWPTTTGTWACPGPAARARRSTTTAGPSTAARAARTADEDRYLEVWNLVFMQYQLSAVRGKDDFDIQGELPSRNIDTGMGLERMAAILQGVDNIYEIDTMWKVLDRAAELTEQQYGRDHRSDVALRVVADHVRTAVMLVADGVLPANEGRGYVLRRILRRSIRNLRLLAGGQRGGGGAARRRASATCTSSPRSRSGRWRAVPRAAQRDAPRIHDGDRRGGGGVPRARCAPASAIFDAAVGETRRRGGSAARRRPGLPAARHLRLPDRPHPGDGQPSRA